MFWLVLSICCSVSVSHLLKLTGIRGWPRYTVFLANYAVATLIGVSGAATGSLQVEPIGAIVLAAILGILYVVTLGVFSVCIQQLGAGLSTTLSRLSVALPIAGSIYFFGEPATGTQVAGIVLGIGLLPLSGREPPGRLFRPANDIPKKALSEPSGSTAATVIWSLLLFVLFGINEFALKVRLELYPESDANLFFAIVFFAALVASVGLVLIRAEPMALKPLLAGCLLGGVNFGSAYFLSRGLAVIAGYRAYAINGIGIILLVVITGIVIWGERPRLHTYVFLVGAAVAVFLLRS